MIGGREFAALRAPLLPVHGQDLPVDRQVRNGVAQTCMRLRQTLSPCDLMGWKSSELVTPATGRGGHHPAVALRRQRRCLEMHAAFP